MRDTVANQLLLGRADVPDLRDGPEPVRQEIRGAGCRVAPEGVLDRTLGLLDARGGERREADDVACGVDVRDVRAERRVHRDQALLTDLHAGSLQIEGARI